MYVIIIKVISMNKKGFTLLELLAVIVILAIIALIVTPFVSKAIKQAKKSAFKNTAYGIIASLDVYQAKNLKDNVTENITFIYSDYEEYSSLNDDLIPYKGKNPKDGIVLLRTNGQVELAISDGVYCAYKKLNVAEVSVIDGNCPDNIMSKYKVDLSLISKTDTTIEVEANMERDDAEYYFRIDNGIYISNIDKSDNTFMFGNLTPGTKYTIIARVNTIDGYFLSQPLEVTTDGYTVTSSVLDITNTTIQVKTDINPESPGNYYFKIDQNDWVSNEDLSIQTYTFKNLTKNTSYTIITKVVNDYGEYVTEPLTVKTKDLKTNVIQYKSSIFNPCVTGSNTCQPGFEDVWSDCATGYNSCTPTYAYRIKSAGNYYTCLDSRSVNFCYNNYSSSSDISNCIDSGAIDHCAYNGNDCKTYSFICSSCGTTSNTCQGGYVQGRYLQCKTGTNTCVSQYIWDADWKTVKPNNTSMDYCKKRVCTVGSDGIIDSSNCVNCSSCESSDDETCINSLTPALVDLQPNPAGGWQTYSTGSNWVSINSNNIYVHGQPNSRQYVYAYRTYDLTNYRTLTVRYTTNGYTGQGDWVIYVYAGSKIAYSVIVSSSTVSQTLTLDVSSLVGNQTIKIGGTAQPEGGDVAFNLVTLSR